MENLTWILIEASIKAFVILNIVLLGAATSVYLERKVSAVIQDRIGPNRVGPFGLFQPFADVIKLLFKEDVVDRKSVV